MIENINCDRASEKEIKLNAKDTMDEENEKKKQSGKEIALMWWLLLRAGAV